MGFAAPGFGFSLSEPPPVARPVSLPASPLARFARLYAVAALGKEQRLDPPALAGRGLNARYAGAHVDQESSPAHDIRALGERHVAGHDHGIGLHVVDAVVAGRDLVLRVTTTPPFASSLRICWPPAGSAPGNDDLATARLALLARRRRAFFVVVDDEPLALERGVALHQFHVVDEGRDLVLVANLEARRLDLDRLARFFEKPCSAFGVFCVGCAVAAGANSAGIIAASAAAGNMARDMSSTECVMGALPRLPDGAVSPLHQSPSTPPRKLTKSPLSLTSSWLASMRPFGSSTSTGFRQNVSFAHIQAASMRRISVPLDAVTSTLSIAA